MILNTFTENFKKYSLESVETLFASQKKHAEVLLTEKFRKLFNILKFESKVALKLLFRPKTDSKHFY